MDRKTVAVVDGHPLLVQGLSHIVQGSPVFSLEAAGSKAGDICAIALRYHPAVLVMDLNIEGYGPGVIAEALAHAPDMKIVIYTASTDVEQAVRALEAGARAYVLKGSPAESLMEAIGATCRGEIYITPSFAAGVIAALQKRALDREQNGPARLSVREAQIVSLLLCGKRNREIAATLSLSEKTVKGYMTLLMQKLNARNRLEVVLAAQKLAASPIAQQRAASRPPT